VRCLSRATLRGDVRLRGDNRNRELGPRKVFQLQRSFETTTHFWRSSTTQYRPMLALNSLRDPVNLCWMGVSNISHRVGGRQSDFQAVRFTSQLQRCYGGSRCTLSRASVIVMGDSITGVGIADMSRYRARGKLWVSRSPQTTLLNMSRNLPRKNPTKCAICSPMDLKLVIEDRFGSVVD
jgi:hypothetical protein